MDKKQAYRLFLDGWGYDAQADITIEEMSELTKALCKYKRHGKENSDDQIKQNVKEEIADVLNMAEQLAYYFGEEEIEKIRQQKIERALKRLQK